MADDDRYARRNITLSPEADETLEALRDETGKSYSEIVCLGLASLRGNQRMIRHVLAQPLGALRLNLNLLAAMCGEKTSVEIVAACNDQFRRIDQLLDPPSAAPKPAK